MMAGSLRMLALALLLAGVVFALPIPAVAESPTAHVKHVSDGLNLRAKPGIDAPYPTSTVLFV